MVEKAVKVNDLESTSAVIYSQINGGETGMGINNGIVSFACKASYGNCWTAAGWVSVEDQVTDTDWHNYTAVYNRNAGYIELYVDYQLVSSNSVNNGSLANCDLYNATIGGYGVLIDEVSIFNTALSQSEIENNICNSLSGSESDLINYWNFNEGGGSSINGLGANSISGTFTGEFSDQNSCNPIGNVESIVWSTGETSTSITVSPTETMTYSVEVTQDGVTCTDEVTITVIDIPDSLPESITSCDESVTLTAAEGYNYLWSTGETTQSIIVDESGEYSVEVSTIGEPSTSNVSSLEFDGDNDRVTIPHSSDLNTPEMSVLVNVLPHSFGPSENYIIDKSYDPSPRYWAIRNGGGGK